MHPLGGVLNHYPRNIGDYVKDTLGLSMEQDGAYSRLLDQYYAGEKALPLARAELYGIARCTKPSERKAVDFVLGKFFTETADGWRQKRCDVELEDMVARSKSASRSAKLRWSERNANADANAMRTHSDGNAKAMLDSNQQPATSNQKPATKGKTRQTAAPLPDWLPTADWARWRKHRGGKLTAEAVKLQLPKLHELMSHGFTPGQLIDLAIESGWATFYLPKTAGRTGLTSAGERTAESLREWMEPKNGTDGP